MATDLRDAARQALEALESLFTLQADYARPKQCGDAITALRAALEQPEQEPVILHRELVQVHPDGTETWSETPLFTHPPRREWQGLTEPVNYFEVQRIAHERGLDYNKFAAALRDYAALKERNV